MLGYGGHPITKSGHYSTTFGALRAVRADYRATPVPEDVGDVVVVPSWEYQSSRWPSLSLRLFADQIRQQIEIDREEAKWALKDLLWKERNNRGDEP